MKDELNLKTGDRQPTTYICRDPQETFDLGMEIGEGLAGGEVILLEGGLGAGKTLLTKGILDGLDFDVDEVTSPSFTLVNRYQARLTVFHLDLWRIEENAAFAVGPRNKSLGDYITKRLSETRADNALFVLWIKADDTVNGL